jgi:xanthine dehydrogenase accessory factor
MKDIFAQVSGLREQGIPFSLVTIISVEGSTPRDAGSRMIVHEYGKTEGSIGGGEIEKRVIEDSVRLLKENRSERITYDLGSGEDGVVLDMACGGRTEVLIEPFKPSIKVFIFGAGHIGRILAQLCTLLGFPYWIVDNRKEYANEDAFHDARGVIHSEFKDSFTNLPIDKYSYLIIVTYGHRYDAVCMEEALKTKAAYIGMIGSKSKVRGNFTELERKGIATNDPRIYAPVGLQIGDNSPEEIGISIIAEIVKLKSEGAGTHMRETSL